MSIKLRQELERRIARAAIRGLLAAGFEVSVFDGEEEALPRTDNPGAILAAMMTTDEDYLIAHKPGAPNVRGGAGWVRFIYGNDGWDVINDYTVNLEAALTQAHKIAERYQ
jgi:hypothetical protein